MSFTCDTSDKSSRSPVVRPILGPELRRGLTLYRVVNRTGLQIREEAKLDSLPCGRIYAGDVFCVNRSSTVQHSHRFLTRLHVVEPCVGWVTGLLKWVEKFQDGDRPGPIPLKSTLVEKCGVIMKSKDAGGVTSVSTNAANRRDSAATHSSRPNQPGGVTPRTRWLHSRRVLVPGERSLAPAE